MDNNQFRRPVATLSHKNTILDIPDLPAKLGRNDQTVDLFYFHESISREHCVFECINRKYTVRDLSSTAGTFINGAKLDPGVPYHIEDGDTIKIGKIKFVFNANYDELARREQEKVHARMQQEAARDTDGSSGSVRKKTVTVSARELNEFEYDESEVVSISCGLMQEYTPMSYTNRLPKEEIEKALYKKEEEAPESEPAEIASEEAPAAESAAEDSRKTQVLDANELEEAAAAAAAAEAAEPAEAEEAPEAPAEPEALQETSEETVAGVDAIVPEEADEPAAAEATAIHLSWIDDETGENKKVTIETFPFRIGRKSDENDYAILRKGVSRRHMIFDRTEEGFVICDDGSTNGVRLNGQKIDPGVNVKIRSGDSIRVAGITIAVRID